jgi:hypothetical protein
MATPTQTPQDVTPLILDDLESETRFVIDPVNDTLSFQGIEEEVPKEEKPVEKVLTPAQRKIKEQQDAQFASFKECVAFETTVFGIITDIDGNENKTAKFIVETMLFQDPKNVAARLAYLEYAELTGDKLEKFFRHETIKGKIKTLIEHIDEKTEQVNHYHKTRKIVTKLAELKVGQVLAVCTEALKDLKPGKDNELTYDRLILMIGATIDCNKEWIESVRDFVLENPKKDEVITETFKYVQKMLESANDLAKKGAVTKPNPDDKSPPKEAVVDPEQVQKLFVGTPTEPVAQKEEKKDVPPPPQVPVPVTSMDALKAYVQPILFALFIYPAPIIKMLNRRFVKIVNK